MVGLATSLGLGAGQALGGLNYLFGVPITDGMKVLLVVLITAFASISVVAGLDKGVKRLLEANMVLAALLLILVIIVGPTIAILTVFGGAALDQVMGEGGQALKDAALEVKMFTMFEAFPLTGILGFIGIILVVVFFVTSSDSGSLVIDAITAGGKTDAPTAQRVFWCILEGVIAIALLLGGGLGALQAAAIATGFPFTIVLMLICVSIFLGLRAERRRR